MVKKNTKTEMNRNMYMRSMSWMGNPGYIVESSMWTYILIFKAIVLIICGLICASLLYISLYTILEERNNSNNESETKVPKEGNDNGKYKIKSGIVLFFIGILCILFISSSIV